MSAPVKDVLVIGFGAVGAIYALILKRSGLARVTAVARSNYDAIDAHGIHYKSKKYGNISGWRPDRLVRSVSEAADRSYSYVLVTTKAIPERLTTPAMLKPLLSSPYTDNHRQPTYVLIQNGLNVERDLYHTLKGLGKDEPSIISVAIWIATNLLEPNVVEHGDFARVTLGVYRHNDFTTEKNTHAETALLEDIGGILESGGSAVEIVPEVQRKKFAKNFWNVAFSSFATLTSYRIPSLFRSPPSDPSVSYTPYLSPVTADLINMYTIPTIKSTLRELVILGRAIGYPDSESGLPSSLIDGVVENTRQLHVTPDMNHKPSMMLDVERDQPIEVEVIFGEVVRMAKERGIEVPRVEMLYALLLVIQNQILRKISEAQV